ncbi:MAG: leucine-rich repeat domain-containing protein [Clostridia bacterium]|nr:leucine-rich repeat domain-containing protein [Clostridia bacterium]
MKLKILVISLVTALMFLTVCTFASAASVVTSSNGLYTYTVGSDNTATIISYLGEETSVTINRIDGKYPVGAISYAAFAGNTKIESVTIYPSVKTIGESAFDSCTNLKTVKFQSGSSLKLIDEFAFSDCTALTTLELPSGIEKIAYGAFRNCAKYKFDFSGLTSLSEIGEYAFSECGNSVGKFTVSIPASVNTIGYAAFYDCKNLTAISVDGANASFSSEDGILFNSDKTELIYYPMSKEGASYTVPSFVKKIGDGSFAGASSLETLVIPEGVTHIGGGAFGNAAKLKTVTIPSSVTYVGGYAFLGCSSLESAEIKNGSVELGSYIFRNCSSLTSAKLPNGLKEIPTGMFDSCLVLSEIEIPATVEKIDQYAFNYCRKLAAVEIPASVKTVGDYAFRYCTSLKTISMPNVTQIGKFAFQTCSILKSADVSGISYIPAYLFDGCAVLSEIALPANYTSIGNYAFNGCKEYPADIVFPASCEVIGDYAFASCSAMTAVTVPETVKRVGIGAFQNSGIASATVECQITAIPASLFSNCSKLTAVSFPDSVKKIGASAFASCVLLKELPTDSFDHIGACAFYGCRSLTKTYFGAKDSLIDYGTYYGCNELESVVIPENISTIGAVAFGECLYLTDVTMTSVTAIQVSAFNGCTALENVAFGSKLTHIGNAAFSGCTRLANVEVPSSVSYVGEDAFVSTKWEAAQTSDFIVLGDGVMYKYQGDKTVTTLIIPGTVKRIPPNRFSELISLQTVIVPDNVGRMAKKAFSVLKKSSSSSSDSYYYDMRSLTIMGKKGSYAETYSELAYFTFKEY